MNSKWLVLLALAGPLAAQVVTIPNETTAAIRVKLNNNFSWLNTNKAGISACDANQFVIRTNTDGVVCAALTGPLLWQALGFVPEPAIPSGTSLQFIGGDKFLHTLDTSAVPESANLYHTTARARLVISAQSPIVYDNSTGIISCPTCGVSDAGGIASLHGLTAATQLFSATNDSNIGLTLGTSGSDTHTFTLSWIGVLPLSRGGLGNTSGNAVTASALQVTPTPCSTGFAPTGILANGNSTGCQALASGAAPGSDTQVLFNDGGSTSASAGLKFNKTTKVLTVLGGLDIGDGTVAGESKFTELLIYGTDFFSWLGNDSRPTTLRNLVPSSDPTAGQVMRFGLPSGGISITNFGDAAGVGPCTNQVVTAENNNAPPTCSTVTSAMADSSISKPATAENVTAARTYSGSGVLDAHSALRTLPHRTGTGSPVSRDACSTIGETYFQSNATAGSNTFGCTATGTPGTWSLQGGGGSSGLADPGSNGLVKRTALNTTAAAVAGTDYQAVIPYTTEDVANKSTDTSLGGGSPSDTLYPSQKAVKQYVDSNLGGGGTGVGRKALSATWTAIADGGCQDQSATWTGISTSDTVALGAPSALSAGLLAIARVSAADTVSLRMCNTSGASITPGSQTFNGTLAVYNLAGTSTINFTSIADGACSSNTFTLTGTAAGDPVTPRWPSGLEAGLTGAMLASATNTVQVRLCNFSGAALDPASGTFGASIAK